MHVYRRSGAFWPHNGGRAFGVPNWSYSVRLRFRPLLESIIIKSKLNLKPGFVHLKVNLRLAGAVKLGCRWHREAFCQAKPGRSEGPQPGFPTRILRRVDRCDRFQGLGGLLVASLAKWTRIPPSIPTLLQIKFEVVSVLRRRNRRSSGAILGGGELEGTSLGTDNVLRIQVVILE